MDLFLDFDGVLSRVIPGASAIARLVPERVARLSRLVATLRPRVIVSSTWRFYGAWQCGAWLRAVGYEGTVYGVTPTLGEDTSAEAICATRGAEILAWRKAHKSRAPYVVLDDLSLRGPVARRLIQTDGDVGLTDADVERVVAMFELRKAA